MKAVWMIVFLGLCCLSSCSFSDTFPEDASQIKVFQSNLRLFATPGAKGRAIRNLKPGEILEDLNEVSPFLTPLRLQEHSYLEPWLKVRTKQQEEGWVYGAVLYNQHGQAAPQLLNKRLAALFGTMLAQKILRYQEAYQQARSATTLAQAYQDFRTILDSLHLHTTFAQAVDPTYTLPDLFWLPQVLPGVVPQMLPGQSTYTFFTHFGRFYHKALQTEGKEDDAFFAWCLQQYPGDSIEYVYPHYIIETQPGRGHSLLGRGLHLQTLEQLDTLYRRKNPFQSDLILAKNRCINDMTASRAAYWEKADKIIAELAQICKKDLVILTKADKIALETRLLQLQKPDQYGLQTDWQSGRRQE